MHWLCRKTEDFSRESLDQALSQLSPSRYAHILRMRHQKDRDRSVAAQLLVQELMAQLGLPSAPIHRAENGQPYLENSDLCISLSHSGDMVACALSDVPVGIDIEKIRPMDLRLCRRYFTSEEQAFVLGDMVIPENPVCEDPAVLNRFFEVWTGKEAYFKRLGTGITDLRSVNILPLQRQCHQIDGYMLQIL